MGDFDYSAPQNRHLMPPPHLRPEGYSGQPVNAKCMIVMSSEVNGAKRWDPGFFITRGKHQKSIDAMKMRYGPHRGPSPVLDLLAASRPLLTAECRRDLLMLARGSPRNESHALEAVFAEYPFESLGIIFSHRQSIIQASEARIREEQSRIDRIGMLFGQEATTEAGVEDEDERPSPG